MTTNKNFGDQDNPQPFDPDDVNTFRLDSPTPPLPADYAEHSDPDDIDDFGPMDEEDEDRIIGDEGSVQQYTLGGQQQGGPDTAVNEPPTDPDQRQSFSEDESGYGGAV
jgi:hypothetical protein